MQTGLRRYVISIAVPTAATPFVAAALVAAFPNHAKTIEDLFGIPVAFGIAQSAAYHFFFRTKRLPTRYEHWQLVGACTAVGAALAIVSLLRAGMSVGFIVFILALTVATQAAVLAMSFLSFMGRNILKHVEKVAAKQGNMAD
ncbi:ABZJ_00895 family protein [Aminobacter ciceronei]|jgi:hypothetical protein|uniref:ABZJ_00895 family protein n=1 Tax=Aminobacter ciceronei TaxID=150723 RepID=UPI003F6EA40C